MIGKIYTLGKKVGIIGPKRAFYVAWYRLGFLRPKKSKYHPLKFKKLYWIGRYTLRKRGGISALSYWHYDKQTGHQFDSASYYKDIKINEYHGMGIGPDIKNPWEFSRFQFLASCTHEQFKLLINDWLAHNPYERGINWLCPMEVGIRAINWIIALQFFYDTCDKQLREKMIRSLYEHMQYLESNWELADGRTSNHYLSDLVGYLYCAWFFDEVKKQQWVIGKIEEEMAWQIFDEGTSYEGSTSYHRLVTELFIHAKLMASECKLEFSSAYYEKLKKMQEFESVCGSVMIGDDDSGRVSNFELLEKKEMNGLFNYAQFGLAIIKTDVWHVTVRSHAYHPRQPSGHFHDDAGSITLSYKGIAILVDPGSYLYTASSQWRDYFRSPDVHNKVYKKNHDMVAQSDMFTLKLPEVIQGIYAAFKRGIYYLETMHIVDEKGEHNAHIKVECDTLRNYVCVSYSVECDAMLNFTFGIGVTLQREDDEWVVVYEGEKILYMKTEINFEMYEGWVAPAYGVKKKVVGLRAATKREMAINFLPLLKG